MTTSNSSSNSAPPEHWPHMQSSLLPWAVYQRLTSPFSLLGVHWPCSISHYTRRSLRLLAVLARVIFCVLMTLFALSASVADLMSYRGSIIQDQQSLNNAAMIFPWAREIRIRRLE